jgi:hypothetical protein
MRCYANRFKAKPLIQSAQHRPELSCTRSELPRSDVSMTRVFAAVAAVAAAAAATYAALSQIEASGWDWWSAAASSAALTSKESWGLISAALLRRISVLPTENRRLVSGSQA